MTEKDLNEMVDHELQWLRNYTHRDSRKVMTLETEYYTDLKPMGYVKKMMSLEQRCVICFIESDYPIVEGMDLSLLRTVGPPRNNNLTPLEVMSIIFPERKQEYIDYLHPGEIDTKIFTIKDKNSRRYWMIEIDRDYDCGGNLDTNFIKYGHTFDHTYDEMVEYVNRLKR